MAIASVNPATGEELKTFDALTEEEVDRKIAIAADTFREYRETPLEERARMMSRAAEILEERTEELGRIATLEMGKTFVAAKAEVHKCARGCRYYAENAARFLADEPAQVESARAFVRYQPIGPILAIMPWNFPYWQAFRNAAPALMAGNVILLKHASNVPQCALAIEEVIHQAGFPEGVFQTLLIGSSQVEAVIDDPRVRAVTLTGSEPAGRQVGGEASANVKPSVLELGGSDPFVVMPSANLDETVTAAVTARTLNNGQSCINGKRFIVHEEIAEDFTRRYVEAMQNLKVGDPMDENTDMGPLATPQMLEDVDSQVRKTVEAGARVLTGGKPEEGPGNFYPPTVITDIPKGSPAHEEEIFGPVASLFRARHRRGDSPRQRHLVRPWLLGVDQRPLGARAVHERAGGRHGLHQPHSRVQPGGALRRCQELRLRSRALPLWHPRVRQRQDRLDRRERRGRQHGSSGVTAPLRVNGVAAAKLLTGYHSW